MIFQGVNSVGHVVVVDVACDPFVSQRSLHMHFALFSLSGVIRNNTYLSKKIVQLVLQVRLKVEVVLGQLQKQHKSFQSY